MKIEYTKGRIVETYNSNVRYFYNGVDVTFYIMRDENPPLGFRPGFGEIEVRQINNRGN